MSKREMNDKKWFFMSLRGGSTSDVYLVKYGRNYFVLKLIVSPMLTSALASKLIKDHINIRNLARNCNLRIPHLFGIKYIEFCWIRLIYILESFEGISIRDLVYSKTSKNIIKIVVNEAIKYIAKMPENIPFDTCPGNFVVNEKGLVTFVDFMPPLPWKYKEKSREYKKLRCIFQGFNFAHYSFKKIHSYNIYKGRVKRFNYYLKQHIIKYQSNIFTTTNNCV